MKTPVCLIAVVLLVHSVAASADSERPNIVLFLVDDMGWQDTSVPFHTDVTPLNRRYRTPNMERLARSGMKFTQAYACSVSLPTRVSLMTGLNADRHRVTNWTLRKNASNDRRHPTLSFPFGGQHLPATPETSSEAVAESVAWGVTISGRVPVTVGGGRSAVAVDAESVICQRDIMPIR